MNKVVLSVIFLALGVFAKAQGNPCLQGQSFHIVVLGSSTAAGSGPTYSDSTWVNRYRSYLQKINPANQVANLAQGGTTTYHIMPDWFQPPASRPTTNSSRNISEAIRLNADAIIVNMPSNDAAQNFSVSEQLYNFQTMAAVADSAGIPIWICTTQPRNFGTSQKQLQLDVRDSILQIYGNRAIDFWTSLAGPANGISPLYDSGDGVHLNDAGHKILFQRVVSQNIPNEILDTLTAPDVFVYQLWRTGDACGTKSDTAFVKISNRGIPVQYNLPITWQLQSGASVFTYNDTLTGGVGTCQEYQLSWPVNTVNGGNHQLSVSLKTQGDSVSVNDSAHVNFTTSGLPQISASGDTVCRNDGLVLKASGGDTLRWFDAMGNFLQFGDSLSLATVDSSVFYQVQACRGPFHYQEQLQTPLNTSTDWRGIMFSLIAQDSLVLDSLDLMVEQSGNKAVSAYYLNGSYKGFEGNSGAWTYWGQDNAITTASPQLASLSFTPLLIPAGDTLSIYLQMPAGYDLMYNAEPSESIIQDSLLHLQSGTGITGHFGTTYFPRRFVGSVYYHHGYKPEGSCQRDTTVQIVVRQSLFNLGPDTTLGVNQTLSLSVPQTFQSIQWSTGDTSHQVLIRANNYNPGQWHEISLQAIDNYGCMVYDTLNFFINPNVALTEHPSQKLVTFPNPARGEFNLRWTGNNTVQAKAFNAAGLLIWQDLLTPNNTLILQWPKGLYFIRCDHKVWRQIVH